MKYRNKYRQWTYKMSMVLHRRLLGRHNTHARWGLHPWTKTVVACRFDAGIVPTCCLSRPKAMTRRGTHGCIVRLRWCMIWQVKGAYVPHECTLPCLTKSFTTRSMHVDVHFGGRRGHSHRRCIHMHHRVSQQNDKWEITTPRELKEIQD